MPLLDGQLARARLDSFRERGYCLIEQALPREFAALLGEEFMEEMHRKILRSGITPFRGTDPRHTANEELLIHFRPQGGNHDLNRWNMHLPSSEPFLDTRIIAHHEVYPILEALFDDPICFIIASDTPFPGSGFQSIHQDGPDFAVTINIALVDCTEDNAPLEVWPGSHSAPFSRRPAKLSRSEIEQFMARHRSELLLPTMGSIILRDQRLLHRGTVNRTDAPRPFLSLWYKERPTDGIPDRSLSDRYARRALEIREAARRSSDERTLDMGNYLGRLVDELAASDRTCGRAISAALWSTLAPEVRRLLRFATIHGALLTESRSAVNPVLDSALELLFGRLAAG